MKLNESQSNAVYSLAPNILVVAGAGSGKTQTMTQRISRILETGEKPESILALTFTRKAAEEMRNRLRKHSGRLADRVKMGTFHAIGLFILQKWGERIGYRTTEGKRISVVSLEESEEVMTQVMREYGVRTIRKREFEKTMKDLAHHNKEPENADHKRIIQEYWNRLKECNSVDFDLILLETQKLLKDPEVSKFFRDRWKWVFVDEYQDTDRVQYNLHDLIDPENLFVVGDPDQAIYGWRGADLEIILSFQQKKGAEAIFLNECYRCAENIVQASNDLISFNENRYKKSLLPLNPPGIVRAQRGGLDVVSKLISEDLAFEDPGEIAVLARTHYFLKKLQEVAEGFGVQVHRVGADSESIEKNRTWKGFIGLVKCLWNPYNNIAFLAYVCPLLGLSSDETQSMVRGSREKGISYESALRISNPGNKFEVFREFYGLANEGKDLAETWKDFKALFKPDQVSAGEVEKYLVETVPDKISIGAFLEWIQTKDLHAELEKKKEGKITFCTCHAAKGLEWDNVILVGFDQGTFPNGRSDEEEERRLAYVAMTRARKRLEIFYETEPSKFIREAGL